MILGDRCIQPSATGVGVLSVCYCPPGWACNYGMGLKTCADNTCLIDLNGDAGCPSPDGGQLSDGGP